MPDEDCPVDGTDALEASDEQQNVEEDGEENVEEYSVEAIRDKRINPDSGITEYLIKWENYAEAENTWEPVHHLQCPDLITKFEEKETSKRKRRKTKELLAKRLKSDKPVLLEDEPENSCSTRTSSTDRISESGSAEATNKEPVVPRPKGFDRGLSIERIVGSCSDDDDKIWFFVKWSGLGELELVEATELEDKAPRDMCLWYRERLYYTIKTNSISAPDDA